MPFSGLMIFENSSQNSGRHFIYTCRFIRKGTTQEQPNGRDAQPGVGRGVEPVALPVPVFINPEAL